MCWIEGEDFSRQAGKAEVVEEWSAADRRFVRFCGCVGYGIEVFPDVFYMYLRVRNKNQNAVDISVECGKDTSHVTVPAHSDWQWAGVWMQIGGTNLSVFSEDADIDLDGLYISREKIKLPEGVKYLEPFLGEIEAKDCQPAYYRNITIQCETGVVARQSFVEAVSGIAGGNRVLQALSGKSMPYLLSLFDVQDGTDYDSDYVWHLTCKEKLFYLLWENMLGIVNPNSDIAWVIGFEIGGKAVWEYKKECVMHTANIAHYKCYPSEGLIIDVVFAVTASDVVRCDVCVCENATAKSVTLLETLAKTTCTDPPANRWTRPEQKFGHGVFVTAGSVEWTASDEESGFDCMSFYEWSRSRCRGRRLAVGLYSSTLTDSETGSINWPEGAICKRVHSVENDTSLVIAARRYSDGPVVNHDLVPDYYKQMSCEQVVQTIYDKCVVGLEVDCNQFMRESLAPYHDYPELAVDNKDWEWSFYSCLELIRASTFNPRGNIGTPYYNFCRVHAHEPQGWWAYGMHSHESLSTLFANFATPALSADFLRGHLQFQREDGKLPYGVSHLTSGRTRTDEATAPILFFEAWQSYLWSGDKDFLREAYEAGKKSHRWWLATRDRCGEGLVHWLNRSWESVRDDNDLATWLEMGGGEYQEALDLNCYLSLEELVLCEMAKELEKDEEAEEFQGLYNRRAKAMNAYMWHEEDRVYYGIGEVVPGYARVKDISTFFPLLAGIAPEGRYENITRLANGPDTFGTPYGPPTLARNERGFESQMHWKGANWVEMSLFVILGLKNYGYYNLASSLAYRNTQMVFHELVKHGHFREYFDSVTGEGLDLVDYIWTGTPAFFIVDVFFGVRPTRTHLEVMPAISENWGECRLGGLRVRNRIVDVCVRIDRDARYTRCYVDGRETECVDRRGLRIGWADVGSECRIEIVQPPHIEDTPKAPKTAPEDWSDVPPHSYPDDEDLLRRVQEIIAEDEKR